MGGNIGITLPKIYRVSLEPRLRRLRLLGFWEPNIFEFARFGDDAANFLNINRLGNNFVKILAVFLVGEKTFHIRRNCDEAGSRPIPIGLEKYRYNLHTIQFWQVKIQQCDVIDLLS